MAVAVEWLLRQRSFPLTRETTMKVGACYDPAANELRIRLRGVTVADARQVFLYLSRFLQSLALPELWAMGQAIQATLEEGYCGTDHERNGPNTSPDDVLT
jgi:hypothetical protein